MPKFEIVKTEYTDGSFKGVDYGAKIRIVMRSASMVVISSGGLRLIPRKEHSSYVSPFSKDSRRASLELPKTRQAFVDAFGEGADEAVIESLNTRGMGTVLVDGGGDPFSLPRVEARAINHARFEAITPSFDTVSPNQKLCIQCEKPLPRSITRHWLSRGVPKPDQAKTIEECQRLSNEPVVKVQGYPINSPEEWWPLIEYFETWDGESHDRIHFCGTPCAAAYGMRAAAELPLLPPNGEIPKHQYKAPETVYHYEVKEEYIDTPMGRIRI